jgi:hypothetical protein
VVGGLGPEDCLMDAVSRGNLAAARLSDAARNNGARETVSTWGVEPLTAGFATGIGPSVSSRKPDAAVRDDAPFQAKKSPRKKSTA